MAFSSSHLGKKTAKEHAHDYRYANFYEDGGVLFCRICAKAVDCLRKATIGNDIQRYHHRKNADTKGSVKQKGDEEPLQGNSAGGTGVLRKQSKLQTLESAIATSEAKHDIVLQYALLSANVSGEKVDNPKLRLLLQTHVHTHGGSMPGSHALRRGVPEVFRSMKQL